MVIVVLFRRVDRYLNRDMGLQVLAWEQLHPDLTGEEGSGREPKLLRFSGRPSDFSPKARLKMLFGHPAPFDRHDWIGHSDE